MSVNTDIVEVALRFMESAEMVEFLRANAKKIRLPDCMDMIVSARADISDKLNALKEMVELSKNLGQVEWYERWRLDVAEKSIEAAEFAINEMVDNTPIGTVFLLNGRFLGEWQLSIPFLTFEAAKRFAFKCAIEDYEDDAEFMMYDIEKWIPLPDGTMQDIITWVMSYDGVVWFLDINEKYNKRLSESSRCFHGYSLCEFTGIPVPFKAGDIITLDCRPAQRLKHGVIAEIGDNRDCCAVQLVYFDDESCELEQRSLKHYRGDSGTPFTCMYRVERFKGELPENEKILYGVSKMVKEGVRIEWDKVGLKADNSYEGHILDFKGLSDISSITKHNDK